MIKFLLKLFGLYKNSNMAPIISDNSRYGRQSLRNLGIQIHANAIEKGWWEKNRNLGEMLALVHSEVSEALEADRKNHYADWTHGQPPIINPEMYEDNDFKDQFEKHIKDTFEDEMSDTVIRILDICHSKGIDLEWHILQKMRYNTLRPYKHGNKKY